MRQDVLDGGLISGLELEEAEGLNHQELELLPMGGAPLALAFCPKAPVLVGAVPGRTTPKGRAPGERAPGGRAPGERAPGVRVAEGLVPDRGLAPGLRRLLRELGLPLRNGGNSLQTPDDWIGRIQGSPLAPVVADREADSWASLQRWPPGPPVLGAAGP